MSHGSCEKYDFQKAITAKISKKTKYSPAFLYMTVPYSLFLMLKTALFRNAPLSQRKNKKIKEAFTKELKGYDQ